MHRKEKKEGDFHESESNRGKDDGAFAGIFALRGAVRRGAGYVNFNIRYGGKDQTHTSMISAENSTGRSDWVQTVTVTKSGNYGRKIPLQDGPQ